MKQKHLFSLLDTSFTTIRVVFKNNEHLNDEVDEAWTRTASGGRSRTASS